MLDFMDRDDQQMVNTRCLAGKVGEFIIIARELGSERCFGVMGGRDPREMELPLGFLGPG